MLIAGGEATTTASFEFETWLYQLKGPFLFIHISITLSSIRFITYSYIFLAVLYKQI